MNIAELRSSAKRFSAELQKIKDNNPPDGFTWYGYDILSNLVHLDNLLSGERRDLFSRLDDKPIADVGAADGDLSYFLESVGLTSDIIDYGPTNWNGLRAARHLKDVLGSSVAIHEMDLDAYFDMPRSRYGLILMLGILYHLKNPFYVLERFAKHSDLLVLSTRIARYALDGTPLKELPLAYLLAPDECNNDASNFWIFSEAGLRRILDRSGWEILDFHTAGDGKRSNPADPDRDERAFVLARAKGA
jgi:tRNA (mo5U34)-methyltransferase